MKCSALFYCKILKQIGISRIFSSASGSDYFLGRSSSTCKVTREKWARLDKSACHMKMSIGRLRRPPPLIQNLNGAIRNHRRLWSKYVAGLAAVVRIYPLILAAEVFKKKKKKQSQSWSSEAELFKRVDFAV